VIGDSEGFVDKLGLEGAGGDHDEAQIDNVEPVCVEIGLGDVVVESDLAKDDTSFDSFREFRVGSAKDFLGFLKAEVVWGFHFDVGFSIGIDILECGSAI